MFDPRDRQLYELREDVASLWSALDGQATFGALSDELAEVGDLPVGDAATLLSTILESLAATGLVALETPGQETPGQETSIS